MLFQQSAEGARIIRDRRHHGRVDVLGQVGVRLTSRRLPTEVRDLSLAGISLETTQSIAPGTPERLFVHSVADDCGVEVDATAIHCRRLSAPAGLAIFLVGFAFRALDDAARETLATIVENIGAISVADQDLD